MIEIEFRKVPIKPEGLTEGTNKRKSIPLLPNISEMPYTIKGNKPSDNNKTSPVKK